jgi:hypothetical protein
MRATVSLAVAVGIIATLASIVSAATSLAFSEYVQMDFSWSPKPVPKWSNGALIDVQDRHTTHPLVWILQRQGSSTVPFSISGAQSMNIYDWDRGTDGSVWLSGSAIDGNGSASSFVAWISPDQTTSNVIRTSLYRPGQIAIAPDGTLWTAGLELASTDASALNPTGGVIRHFDRTGNLLNSFVPQSTIQNASILLSPANQFRASGGFVAWYSPKGARCVELSTSGATLMDIAVPVPGNPKSQVGGLGLTPTGDLFVSATWPAAQAQGSSGSYSVFILSKSAAAWLPVLQRSTTLGARSQLGDFGHIYGVDGTSLVLHAFGGLNFYSIVN